LSVANAQPPLTLQNVIIQESNTFVPVSIASQISVSMDARTHKSLLGLKQVTEITKQMREGVPPAHLFNQTGVTGGIILIHGYCSGTNPWSPYPGDWTNPYFFLNSDASITNDAFSQLVLAYADSNSLTSFALVGHSQGGMVAAHIKNYYFSGLDANKGAGRKIQALGTPFQGCSAAGSAANLGKAFGVGCGENFDLSTDGAVLWLSGISADSRDEVHFYTTTYKQGNFFGDYCNMAVNMVLEWPNDGTSEYVYTDLVGGHDEGNTQQQCHTTDMKYSAQYYDHKRNSDMNSFAAR